MPSRWPWRPEFASYLRPFRTVAQANHETVARRTFGPPGHSKRAKLSLLIKDRQPVRTLNVTLRSEVTQEARDDLRSPNVFRCKYIRTCALSSSTRSAC